MSDEYRDWEDEPVKVVKNHEGICSIWPADRENALGWEDVGFSGPKEDCLNFIKENCDADARWVGGATTTDATPTTAKAAVENTAE